MARKLALFFDGTWNNPGSHTNVRRLFALTAADQQFRGAMGRTATVVAGSGGAPSQLTFYHPGVGVKWGEKIRGGAFGTVCRGTSGMVSCGSRSTISQATTCTSSGSAEGPTRPAVWWA